MAIKINPRDKYEELFKFVPQEKWGDLNQVIEEYKKAGGVFETPPIIPGAKGKYAPISMGDYPYGIINVAKKSEKSTAYHELMHMLDDIASPPSNKVLESVGGEDILEPTYLSQDVLENLEESQGKSLKNLLVDLGFPEYQEEQLSYRTHPSEFVSHIVSGKAPERPWTGTQFEFWPEKDLPSQLESLLDPFDERTLRRLERKGKEFKGGKKIGDLVRLVEAINLSYKVAGDAIKSDESKKIFSEQSLNFLEDYLREQYENYLSHKSKKDLTNDMTESYLIPQLLEK